MLTFYQANNESKINAYLFFKLLNEGIFKLKTNGKLIKLILNLTI